MTRTGRTFSILLLLLLCTTSSCEEKPRHDQSGPETIPYSRLIAHERLPLLNLPLSVDSVATVVSYGLGEGGALEKDVFESWFPFSNWRDTSMFCCRQVALTGGRLLGQRVDQWGVHYYYGGMENVWISFEKSRDAGPQVARYDSLNDMLVAAYGEPIWTTDRDTLSPAEFRSPLHRPALYGAAIRVVSMRSTPEERRRPPLSKRFGYGALWYVTAGERFWKIETQLWRIEDDEGSVSFGSRLTIEQLPDSDRLAHARSIVSEEREFEGMLIENVSDVLDAETIYGFRFYSCDSIDPNDVDDLNREWPAQLYRTTDPLVLLDYPFGNHEPFHYALDSFCHPGDGQPLIRAPIPWSDRNDCRGAFRNYVRFRGYAVDARHVGVGKAGIVVTEVLEVGPEDEIDCQ